MSDSRKTPEDRALEALDRLYRENGEAMKRLAQIDQKEKERAPQ